MIDFHASDLFTIALLVALEGLLSADNAMVLAVLVLSLPRSQQQKALRYGILGAFAFRIIATALAAYTSGLLTYHLVLDQEGGFRQRGSQLAAQIQESLTALL